MIEQNNWPHRLKPGTFFVVISPEGLTKKTTRYAICNTQKEAQQVFEDAKSELSGSRYQFKKYRYRRVSLYKAITPKVSGMVVKDCDSIHTWYYDGTTTAFNIYKG